MTEPLSIPSDSDLLPPESGALSVPPPVPPKKPGFLRRLFTSRKKQQAVAMQNGYLEMVDLIRAIRSHLDRQENVQTGVLSMLEKVPGAMERQQEVMTMFKQQLENGMENNRRLTDSMGNLNNTLASMDESQRASSRTVTDLIHRSRESEQLLREVMRRAERRMTILLVFFFLLVVAMGVYFVRWQPRARKVSAPVQAVVAIAPDRAAEQAEKPANPPAVAEPVQEEPAAGKTLAPVKTEKTKAKFRTKAEKKAAAKAKQAAKEPVAVPDEGPAVGQPEFTLDLRTPGAEGAPEAVPPGEKPVSLP
jgi:hypothetical protein